MGLIQRIFNNLNFIYLGFDNKIPSFIASSTINQENILVAIRTIVVLLNKIV